MVESTELPGDVAAFLATIPEPRRTDAEELTGLMADATGERPRLWGTSIVGFGAYHYHYATGREGDAVAVGFSPRRAALTLYLCGYLDGYADLLERLGPHTAGKGCLYLKRLADTDRGVLSQIVRRSLQRAGELNQG